MAQEIINIGLTANDNRGDSIRDGGEKINNNFTEVYANVSDRMQVANTNTLVNDRMQVANTNTLVDDRMQVANTNTLVDDRMQVANTVLLVNDRMQVANAQVYLQVANAQVYMEKANTLALDITSLRDTNQYLLFNTLVEYDQNQNDPYPYIQTDSYELQGAKSFGVNGYFKTTRTQYGAPVAVGKQLEPEGEDYVNANGKFEVAFNVSSSYIGTPVWNKEGLHYYANVSIWTDSNPSSIGANYVKVHEVKYFNTSTIGGKININTFSVEANTGGLLSDTNYSSVNEYFFIKNQSTGNYDITTHFQTGDTESQPVGVILKTVNDGDNDHLNVWVKMPYAEGDNSEYDYFGDGLDPGSHRVVGSIEWDGVPDVAKFDGDGFE